MAWYSLVYQSVPVVRMFPTFIHARRHAGIVPPVLVLNVLVFIRVPCRYQQRRVNGRVGQVEEQGLGGGARVSVDDVHGSLGEEVSGVVVPFREHRLCVVVEVQPAHCHSVACRVSGYEYACQFGWVVRVHHTFYRPETSPGV